MWAAGWASGKILIISLSHCVRQDRGRILSSTVPLVLAESQPISGKCWPKVAGFFTYQAGIVYLLTQRFSVGPVFCFMRRPRPLAAPHGRPHRPQGTTRSTPITPALHVHGSPPPSQRFCWPWPRGAGGKSSGEGSSGQATANPPSGQVSTGDCDVDQGHSSADAVPARDAEVHGRQVEQEHEHAKNQLSLSSLGFWSGGFCRRSTLQPPWGVA